MDNPVRERQVINAEDVDDDLLDIMFGTKRHDNLHNIKGDLNDESR